jgi:hypothetical protein
MWYSKKGVIILVPDPDGGLPESGVFVQTLCDHLLKFLRKPAVPGEKLQIRQGGLAEITFQRLFRDQVIAQLNYRKGQY